MKINWKLRFTNKTTLAALLSAVVAFVYQMLGIFGVVPQVGQDSVTNLITVVLNILVMIGVVVDPTTKGVSDSDQALTYTENK